MAENFQTVFGTTPVSEPSTTFANPIAKAVNEEIDKSQLIGITGLARGLEQTGTLTADITGLSAAKATELALTSETGELSLMAKGGKTRLALIRNEMNLASHISDTTVRNLRLAAIRNKLLGEYSTIKGRATINKIFEQTLGTASPIGLTAIEATRTEAASSAAIIKNTQIELSTAKAAGIIMKKADGTDDNQKILAVYRQIKVNSGIITAGATTLKNSSGGARLAPMVFRGENLPVYTKMREAHNKVTGGKMLGLLTMYNDARMEQKPIIAAQIGDLIRNIRVDMANKLIGSEEGLNFVSEAELSYMTSDIQQLYRSLTKGTEIEGAWHTGKLTGKVQLTNLKDTLTLITETDLLSSPVLRAFDYMAKNYGKEASGWLMRNLGPVKTAINTLAAGTDRLPASYVKDAVEVLTGVKSASKLSQDDKQALGLVLKPLIKSGSTISDLKPAPDDESETTQENIDNFCDGLIDTTTDCFEALDDPDNKDELIKALTSNNGISILDKLWDSNKPKSKQIVSRAIRVLNRHTINILPSKIKDLVEEFEKSVGVKLKKGDLITETAWYPELSEDAKNRIEEEIGGGITDEISLAWADGGFDLTDEISNLFMDNLIPFHKYITPVVNGKKLGTEEWGKGLAKNYFNAAIEGSTFEPKKKGWFGLGGYPEEGQNKVETEKSDSIISKTSSLITNELPAGVTNKPPLSKTRTIKWRQNN